MAITTARLHDKQVQSDTLCARTLIALFNGGGGGLAVLMGRTVGHARLSNLILIYDTGTLLTARFM